MDNWIWTISGYFNPENSVKTPLKEQWIFLYSGKENNNPNIFQEENQKYPNNNQEY